jgi:hypothetical protein
MRGSAYAAAYFLFQELVSQKDQNVSVHSWGRNRGNHGHSHRRNDYAVHDGD